MDSDDEIVREVGTDSESENGAESSDGSSDSDTEQVSDDASGHRRPQVLTPQHEPESNQWSTRRKRAKYILFCAIGKLVRNGGRREQ